MQSVANAWDHVEARLASPDTFLTAGEATNLGISARDLKARTATGALERVVRGVYARPLVDPTPESAYRRMVLAALVTRTRAGDRPVIAGPAAVVMYGLPLLGVPPTVVHVAEPQVRGRKPGRLLQPIGPVEVPVTTSAGVRLTGVADAVIDTARLMTVAAGVAAADAALRRNLLTRPELEAACRRRDRAAGVGPARRATRLATGLSESPGESWSAVVIDELGLPAPERQHSMHDDAGFVGRVDFWWPELSVVGEFDGRVKYGRRNPAGRPPEEVLWEEKLREDRLRRSGATVIRWTTAELVQPEALRRRLEPALRRHRP